MTLLGLLTFVTALAGCIGAFIEGRKTGVVGTYIGSLTGIVLGITLWFGIRLGIKLGLRILEQCQPTIRFILGWIFFALVCSVAMASMFLGFQSTKLMIQIVHHLSSK